MIIISGVLGGVFVVYKWLNKVVILIHKHEMCKYKGIAI